MEPTGRPRRVYGMHQPNGRVMTLPEPRPPAPDPPDDPAHDDLTILEVTVVPTDIADHSFDRFYRLHRDRIAKGLAFSIGDVDLAADATDEALVRAYERWAKVQRLDRPEAWVYRVAANWATSVLRRRRRSPHRLYEPAADAPAIADPTVHAGLAALDVKHRSVVVCRYLLGWSVAETAAALGVREGTVKSRLHRALAALHSTLHHLDPKDPR
jgi:RNA polymerase sigma-70 factor (ECF subfamily)